MCIRDRVYTTVINAVFAVLIAATYFFAGKEGDNTFLLNLLFYIISEIFDFCCIKCNPDESEELQTEYTGIRPGSVSYTHLKRENTIYQSGLDLLHHILQYFAAVSYTHLPCNGYE